MMPNYRLQHISWAEAKLGKSIKSFIKVTTISIVGFIALWCTIIVTMLAFYYPREIRRVPGPYGMEAVLKYGPTSNPPPIFTLLLPLLGTSNNCHVFVHVEKDGQTIMYLPVTIGGDGPEDNDDSKITWHNDSLTVTSEHSGRVETWTFEQGH